MQEPPGLEGITAGKVEPRFVLLINPFYPKNPHGSFGKHVLTPAVGLTSLAGATPSGWRVRVWDENLLQGPPPADPLPAVVGISVHLCFAVRSYELARWYKERGSVVVLGGPHVQSCPDEAVLYADAVVLGDGIVAWPRVLADISANKLQRKYEASFVRPYDLDPVPRRELVAPGSFLTTLSLIATRGCPNRCDFCYLSTQGLNQGFSTRQPAEVARQFAESKEAYAVFLDNNLGAHPGYLLRLCRELRPLKKIWSAAVTLDITDDPEWVRAMALAGCTGVFVGLESLNEENLRQSGKRGPGPSEYARRIQVFHDYGIQVNGSFVLGFDGDRRDVFATTAEWIEAQRLECATFHILTPYPGTPLYQRLAREGRLLHRGWERYDTAHAVFRPRHMSPDELELGYDWIYRRLFSLSSIWRRRPSETGAVPAYLAMALLYKKSNPLWHFLIRNQLVHHAWRPVVEWSRWRHRFYRRTLEARQTTPLVPAPALVPPHRTDDNDTLDDLLVV
jgi:radical SAM superfamily enzyme YgiQ (UPF0313 family)